MLVAAMLGVCALYGAAADPEAQIKEAEAILAEKTDYKSRYKATMDKFNAMRKLKQYDAAEKFLLDAVKNDSKLTASIKRNILNHLAGLNLWNGRHGFAMGLLQQAAELKVSHREAAYFYSYWYQAHLYNSRFKELQKAIDTLALITNDKLIHPAYVSDSYGLMGAIYLKLDKKAEALDAYKKAVEFGQKGKRKTANYEKQVELLSK